MIDKDTPFVPAASLEWNDDEPTSQHFSDRYFSDADGLRETEHVFIEGASVIEQWHKALASQQPSTTIMELGFGSGLNFLATTQRWLQWRQKQPDAEQLVLRYFSIEHQPMRGEDMRRSLVRWRDTLSLTDGLIDRLPPRVRGQHRCHFAEHGVELVLLIDDVRTALSELIAPLPFIDVVYLDGFAPAKNPAMWQHGVLQRLAELSRAGATLATFSAAGELRRTLVRVGYDVRRRRGFGHKREMLTAVRAGATKTRLLRDRQPWFALPQASTFKNIAIIGAGLAGASTAHALARRGVAVTVFESAQDIATATSAVPVAGWFPQLSLDFDPRSEILWQACRVVEAVLLELEADADRHPCWQDRRGCFFVADTEARRQHLKTVAARLADAGLTVDYVDANNARQQTGLALPHPGLDCRLGGSLVPAELCRRLLDDAAIELRCNANVLALARSGAQWRLSLDHDIEQVFDAVIVASGARTELVDNYLGVEFDRNEGMVSQLRHPALRGLQRLLCFKGYLTPALGEDGLQVTGATTTRTGEIDDPLTRRSVDHDDENIIRLRRVMTATSNGHSDCTDAASTDQQHLNEKSNENFHATTHWHGVRLSSRDRLPIVGPVVDSDSLRDCLFHYQQSAAMRDFQKPSWHDGLFVNLAHGGRGASTALLCAELLAQMICAEPLCLPRRLANALSPARFIVRDTLSPPHAATVTTD